jgi:hypothetical protein
MNIILFQIVTLNSKNSKKIHSRNIGQGVTKILIFNTKTATILKLEKFNSSGFHQNAFFTMTFKVM